ncbi:MAG: LegC family aminotransferase [Desulfosporosinus sp.]|nr:LegC family aminotransferase [Desulfosporosinus sp.]
MNNEFIPLSVPNIKGTEIRNVTMVLEEEWVSTAGKCITEFEDQMRQYLHVQDACACQTGTAGLHLCLRALDIAENDIVIVPTLTFIATINAVMYQNATPVFFDCDRHFGIDPKQVQNYLENNCVFDGVKVIEKGSGKQVKAIIPVHVFGDMSAFEELVWISRKFNLFIIEDATESLGTKYTKGQYSSGDFAGTIGDLGVFSFNGNKIITTGGGGMVVSNNKRLIEKIRYYSTQAKDDQVYFIHNEVGYNYRMTNIQAALGLAQLERLEEFIEVKKENYFLYKELLEDSKIGTVLEFNDNLRPNYWFYCYALKEPNPELRDKLIRYFADNSIQVRPIWKLNHTQKPFLKFKAMGSEQAQIYYDSIINLPCSSNLSFDQVRRVCKVLLEFEKNM